MHRLLDVLESDSVDLQHLHERVIALAVHAPPHLAVAHRILLNMPVTDVFAIGAVKGDGKAARNPGERYTEKPRDDIPGL
ncbi:MAG: hypothetical protein H6815_05350 [Phycisphaeraceae bacterium]|nr:hypothetical protein [Phycisphaerales bacterium]MCB9859863.1 hypothetical protein [Phycisphaeraceae bacterium]